MSVCFTLSSGDRVEFAMPNHHAARLTKTCFRGTRAAFAGNFFRWGCFAEFVLDSEVRQLLTAKFEELVADPPTKGDIRFEIELEDYVGWDSILDLEEVAEKGLLDRCEFRDVNARAGAQFLPRGLMLAPKTAIVTIVMRMVWRRTRWQFVIGTMYPGQDIGTVAGEDLTTSRGIVFLDWETPGEK